MRAFAVGYRLDLDDAATPAAYAARMEGLMEGIAPRLLPGRANLVVFPEDVGIHLAFLGSRGATARQSPNATLAYGELLTGPYREADRRLVARFPELASPRWAARRILLAVTDTVWRTFYAVFSGIARRRRVWVVASANLAEVRPSSDPEDLAAFRDPEDPARSCVSVPETPDVYNQAFVFDPEGRLVHRIKKVNLVPDEIAALELTPGRLEEVGVACTPAGNLGIAISLDAFVDPPNSDAYVRRLARLGANVLVQPDANGCTFDRTLPLGQRCGWAGTGGLGRWQPDEWLGSVLGGIQPRYGGILFDVNPMMTGNFFDYAFDGQSAVTGRRVVSADRGGNYVGNPCLEALTRYPVGGFLALAPWVAPYDCRDLTDPEAARTLLRQTASALAPGGEREDRYLESIVWADLVFPPR